MGGPETTLVRCRTCDQAKAREAFSPPIAKTDEVSDEEFEWVWTHRPPRQCRDCQNAYMRARTARARARAATNTYWTNVDEPPLKAWRTNKADDGWRTWKRGRPKPRGSLARTAERSAIREQGRTLLKATARPPLADHWPPHTIWGAAQILGAQAVADCTGLGMTAVARIRRAHTDDCKICGPRNPDAPHRVYIFHFSQWEVFKVGITHLSNDTRLTAHRRAGGLLQQTRIVPTWRAALDLERHVLTHTAGRRLRYGTAEFPQGGGTECWADDLVVDLDTFDVPLAGSH